MPPFASSVPHLLAHGTWKMKRVGEKPLKLSPRRIDLADRQHPSAAPLARDLRQDHLEADRRVGLSAASSAVALHRVPEAAPEPWPFTTDGEV